MGKEMASDLYGICQDEIQEGDIFVAQVKPSENHKDLRIIRLVKWDED